MTLPRELRIRDGRLLQTPVSGIETLRERELAASEPLPAACELEITVPEGDFDLNLFTRPGGSGGLRLHYDAETMRCTVDRTGLDRRFNQKVGEVLDIPMEAPLRELRVFIDSCSAELFLNGGEATFTTHVYPTEAEHGYTLSEGAKLRGWELAKTVTDEFVI